MVIINLSVQNEALFNGIFSPHQVVFFVPDCNSFFDVVLRFAEQLSGRLFSAN